MSARLDRLRALLGDDGLDGALITHPSNRFYLSGYTGADDPPNESAGVLLVGPGQAVLLASPNNVEWAQAEAPLFEAATWQRPWVQSVAERIGAFGWHRIGFEDDAILFSTHRDLRAAVGAQAELVPFGAAVDRLRLVKDTDELRAMERAIALTDEVFHAAVDDLAAGTTERALAWRVERLLRDRGADRPAFPTIVASGPNAARPHHSVTERSIQAGEPVVIDLGAHVDGYNGDLTRTVWVGAPDERLRDVYNVVYRAQAAALALMRAGLRGKDADAAARRVIEDAGLGDFCLHGLGHGLGVRVHEGPSASPISTDILRAGEVITVEPGVYIPGWGGVRIEDVVVIEDDGCRVLTAAPKSAAV